MAIRIRPRFAVPLLIVGLLTALRGIDPPMLEDMRFRIFDTYQQMKPRPWVDSPVRVVDIDDESLGRLGQWPWPRTLLAELTGRLADAGVAAIAFDLIFAEPDRTSPALAATMWPDSDITRAVAEAVRLGQAPDHDRAFAQAMQRAPVVAGYALTDSGAGRRGPRKTGFASVGVDPRPFLPAYASAVTNLGLIDRAAKGYGALNVLPDRDNIIRRLPLLLVNRDEALPSLSIEALRVAQDAKLIMARTTGAQGERAFGTATGLTQIKVGEILVPTDANGQVWLYDTGPIPERFVSAWRVLADPAQAAALDGSIVFVGTSATGLRDAHASPLAASQPGVAFHAQVTEQILTQTFLSRPDWATGAEILAVTILGTLLALALPFLPAAMAAIAATVTGAGVVAGSWLAFAEARMLLDPLQPLLAVIVVLLTSTLIGFFGAERDKRRVRSAFSRYLSPELVSRLAANPDKLRLGGEVRPMSVLFCDIRDFTSISEDLDAQALTRLINGFHTPMTDAILQNGGTIDKYIGDAIMAFWNAPIDEPLHARRACLAAIAMRKSLTQINATRAAAGGAPLRMGIGINTGECCVGNLGSEYRFDYSVIGDAVNLASRLEGQSKTYGVDIIIGESTFDAAADLPALEVDLVRVKGKHEPARIFTLLNEDLMTDAAARQAFIDNHRALLGAYRGQAWTDARRIIAAGHDAAHQLGLGALYSLYDKRVETLAADPPGADWDGVTTATTK